MEEFLDKRLQPIELCLICRDHFSADHQPVALPCYHTIGENCIKRWLRSGRGNTNACPQCRFVLFERNHSANFDGPSMWLKLCEQPLERRHSLVSRMLAGIRTLWAKDATGNFTVRKLMNEVVIPALLQAANCESSRHPRTYDPVLDCYNLVAASWDSLGQPNVATGLAVPLIRLARLISTVSSTAPKWLMTLARTSDLLWKANACIDITQANFSWDLINDATVGGGKRNESLLHLYTMLISQSITRNPRPDHLPTRRHEIMNLVVERCCRNIIGKTWDGRPSSEFKDILVVVFEELRRLHLKKGTPGLSGHRGEGEIVRSIWTLAKWSAHKEREA